MNHPFFPRVRLLAAVTLLAVLPKTALAGDELPALEKMEKQVRAVVEKDMPAVVGISYSSKFGMANGSGVVISPEGLVLTAAHVVNDREELDVIFRDGKRVRAKVLGADYFRDVALVKIIAPGPYPSAELGDTKDLAVGAGVVAMGHPGSFDPRRSPPVRFGRVLFFDHARQIRTDSLIMGGDSGGALFDLDGKVIGVLSAKREEQTSNFSSPAEAVRQNWDRLQKGERWGRNPLPYVLSKAELERLEGLDLDQFHARARADYEKSRSGGGRGGLNAPAVKSWLAACGMKEAKIEALGTQELFGLANKAISGRDGEPEGSRQAIPPVVKQQDDRTRLAVKPALDKLAPSVAALMDGGKTLAVGTVIRADGFILTKHSEIAKAKGPLKVRLADGREFTGAEVRQFADHDLALVKIPAQALPAVAIVAPPVPLEIGEFLYTPAPRAADPLLAKGVVSVKDRPLNQGAVYLGLIHVQAKEGVEVSSVNADSPAAKAGLMAKDLLLSLNGRPIATADELGETLVGLDPGAKLRVQYRRGGEEKTAEVTLGTRPKRNGGARGNPGRVDGVVASGQASGFPMVFQHDQPLTPQDCGGIVADLHGQVVGVNIARADRISAYAIPAATVAELLKGVDFEALAKQAAGGK